ncbi:MAG TPA: DUF3375 domain-containing protein [Polyangia bacterium]
MFIRLRPMPDPHGLDYDTLELLRRNHPAWRLLRADHASLVVSFLHRAFVLPNVRALSAQELASRLDDHLFELRARMGEGVFPRPSTEYLDVWSSDDCAWLRKYYPPDSDEAHYDLTPASEKAIEWLTSLRQRQFVATESRLLTVFELLRQIAEGTESDRTARLADLERRKAEIEAKIRQESAGDMALMDETQVKDRFLQMAATARALLTDFREVEENFRGLDRGVRQQIALWEGSKGTLLDRVFGERDAISDSDQGRSFRAFWDFLMSPARQEELTALLSRVFDLAPVRALEPDPRLLRVHYDWLDAGDVAQRTVARLSEQLRRFLDDRVFLENRRIMNVIREIEQKAVAIRDQVPEGPFVELDDSAPEIQLPMDRPLFVPPLRATLTGGAVLEGEGSITTDALFEQVHVDRARLEANVRRALQTEPLVSLGELVTRAPLEHGLAELIAYFSLAASDSRNVIDEDNRQTIVWTDGEGVSRQATLPLVMFVR